MRRLLVSLGLIVMLPGTAFAGGGGGGGPCAGFAEGPEVVMLDSCFSGTAHFAPAGATLSLVNDGQLPHSFTAVDGSFDSGILEAGETFELTVAEPGLVRVFCTLHGTAQGDGMAGVLVVGEPTAESLSYAGSLLEVREAVGAQVGMVTGAIEGQAQALSQLRSTQEDLIEAIEEHTTADEREASDQTPVVLGSDGVEQQAAWLPFAVGVIGGLALAALVVAGLSKTSREAKS